jgi:hypothetical protein
MNYELGKWYPWNGGDCPFAPNTNIRYLLRDGYRNTMLVKDMNIARSSCWIWANDPESDWGNIVAFKIVKWGKE